jgi:hypothetical protein
VGSVHTIEYVSIQNQSQLFASHLDKLFQRIFQQAGKIIGRIAGQMIGMIYALLKTDYETLSKHPLGQEPSPAMLYDPEVQKQHRTGHYRSLKPGTRPRSLIHKVPNAFPLKGIGNVVS